MLSTITKATNLQASSTVEVDGVTQSIKTFTARITGGTENDIVLADVTNNRKLYAANRQTCYADQAEFEDAAYALQAELYAEESTEETTAE